MNCNILSILHPGASFQLKNADIITLLIKHSVFLETNIQTGEFICRDDSGQNVDSHKGVFRLNTKQSLVTLSLCVKSTEVPRGE